VHMLLRYPTWGRHTLSLLPVTGSPRAPWKGASTRRSRMTVTLMIGSLECASFRQPQSACSLWRSSLPEAMASPGKKSPLRWESADKLLGTGSLRTRGGTRADECLGYELLAGQSYCRNCVVGLRATRRNSWPCRNCSARGKNEASHGTGACRLRGPYSQDLDGHYHW